MLARVGVREGSSWGALLHWANYHVFESQLEREAGCVSWKAMSLSHRLVPHRKNMWGFPGNILSACLLPCYDAQLV